MAVTFDKFSIRDYTSKMRSVDVFKCWPFAAGEVSREDVESWLPPMTLPKFLWWSDELAALRSNRATAGGGEPEDRPEEMEEKVVSRSDDERESAKPDMSAVNAVCAEEEEEKLEMVCPVCRDFNASTLTAVNAHIDGCLAQTMREERRQMSRSKSKAPKKKKRSIAEIFQVEEEEPQQPQIETVLKFWPLSEDDADEVSITVTKFRWLSRRLEALRSNGVEGGISNESAKSDEGNLNSAQEEEKLEMVCPVCRVFNAATVTAVNAHIDSCLAQAMREDRWQMRRLSSNPKPKAPKKRSIAEILTVAPQIDGRNGKEAVVEIEEEDEDEANIGKEEEKSGYDGAAIKRKKSTKKNMKRKKMKKVMMKKGKVGKRGVVPLNNESKKMKKTKKKNKNLFNKEITSKKEDAYKRKVQNPVRSSRKLKVIIGNKTVALDDINASSAHEKKLGLKILSEEKKEKVKICETVGKQQKAVSPIRGILKNHKHVSGSTSSGCNIQDGTEESHCDVQVPTSDRHVRFSGKDYTLGPKKKNSFDETVFNLSSDALASLGKEQFTGNDEGTPNLEANRNDDSISINIDKRKEVCPTIESKQFSNAPGQVAVQNFLKPCTNQEKSKHLVEKSESLSKVAFCDNNNLHWFDRGNTTTLHCSPYAHVSRSLSAFQAGQLSGINTQVCESVAAFSSTGKFIDRLEDPTFQSATVNSNANTRTFLEPSSYSASHNRRNERPKFPLHTDGDNENNGQALGGRLSSHIFSADMNDNSFLFPGWGKESVRNNCMDQNYFGLPLNSHGELINFSSSGKVGMNQPETSCTLRGSLSGLPANDILHQSNQEYLSISERHVVQKTLQDQVSPFHHYPARLGVTELHGRERGDLFQRDSNRCYNHYVQPLDSELNLMRNPFIEQNQRDKVPNHKGNGMISPKESFDLISPISSQPTMRLMGKDVPIGRSSEEKQQFLRGDVWAGEESRRQYSENSAEDNSLLGRFSKQDWVYGSELQISNENALQSGKIQSNQALQSTLLMKGPDSEFLNLQSNHVPQNGSLGVSRNASSNLHHITQASTSCAVYNRAPDDLPEQFIYGAKPQGLSFQSQVLPTPCQPTSLSNGELNDRKKHHHVTNSAFGFPFLHPVVEEQAKTPWFQRSYRSLPRWLLGSTHERLPGTASSKSFPQNTWGNNFTTPSVNHSAAVLYAPNSVTYHCPKKTPLCPASIVQPPHVPVTPVTKPPSAINIGCRNVVKVTDRVKLDNMTTKDHHPCTNSRKRHAANLVDLTKPNKLPNIEVQGNSSRMTGFARENSSSELQRSTRAVELDPRVDSARSNCCQNEAQNLNPRSYLGFDSFNMDGVVISGPVKLSPGAKHILKPSPNLDQDNSRPIHSAIPITATTDIGRDLELQRKLTKMYRF